MVMVMVMMRYSSDLELACGQSKTLVMDEVQLWLRCIVPVQRLHRLPHPLLLTSARTRSHNSIVAAADLLVSNDVFAIHIHQLLLVQIAKAVEERTKSGDELRPAVQVVEEQTETTSPKQCRPSAIRPTLYITA